MATRIPTTTFCSRKSTSSPAKSIPSCSHSSPCLRWSPCWARPQCQSTTAAPLALIAFAAIKASGAAVVDWHCGLAQQGLQRRHGELREHDGIDFAGELVDFLEQNVVVGILVALLNGRKGFGAHDGCDIDRQSFFSRDNAQQTFRRRYGGGQRRQQSYAAALCNGKLHHRAIDLHDRDIDHGARQLGGIVEGGAGQKNQLHARLLQVVRVLRELEVVVLRNYADACGNIVALNGVIAEVHYLDVGNIALEKWLHGANGEMNRMNDADCLCLLFHILISYVVIKFQAATKRAALDLKSIGPTTRIVSRMTQNPIRCRTLTHANTGP